MKHLKKFSDDIEIKKIQTEKRYSGCPEPAIKFQIFDNGIFVGKCTVCFRERIFSSFGKHDTEFYEDKKEDPDTLSLYIIGISTMDRKGYGTMLVKHIEDYARNKGCQYSALSSITQALGFWKKIGYKVYSTGDYYSMYKEL